MSAVTELIQRGPAEALAGLLGVPMPEDELPLFWHWVYLLDRPAQRELGPRRARRRGGRARTARGCSRAARVRALAPLRFDAPATRRTEVLDTTEKQGRSGRLMFTTVGQQVFQRDAARRRRAPGPSSTATCRAGPSPDEPFEPRPVGETASGRSRSRPPLLFRFSALTYNGHRIHYDRDYARDVEGYPGLVTHGPLQALAMAEAARARGVGTACAYRLVAPLFEHQGLVVARPTPAKRPSTISAAAQTARATIS